MHFSIPSTPDLKLDNQMTPTYGKILPASPSLPSTKLLLSGWTTHGC